MSSVALPLLVLLLTRSPASAGLVRFASALPLVILILPAGAILDRLDRKRVMLACELCRMVALASIPVGMWFHVLTFTQLLVVSAIIGSGYAFFEVAQRSALLQLVPATQLPAAVTQNKVREYLGLIAGQALGGLLFGISRLVPFLLDAISYLISFGTLLLIKKPFQARRTAPTRAFHRDVALGMAFLWRHAFIRTTAFLGAAHDLVVNALYLVVIVLAQQRGASDAVIGAILGFTGLGGLLGAALASRLERTLSVRVVAIATNGIPALLTLSMLVVRDPLALGLVYGAMFVLVPLWAASISARQFIGVPDELQGRVQSGIIVISLASVPLGSLVVGYMIQYIGAEATVAVLAAALAVGTVAALIARALREAPSLNDHVGDLTTADRPGQAR